MHNTAEFCKRWIMTLVGKKNDNFLQKISENLRKLLS
jgi:hypothetical protein